MTVNELMGIPPEELTDRQSDFLKYYDYRMPVGMNDCVMNKICRRFEQEFDGYSGRHNSTTKFDYTIMKSDDDYAQSQLTAIKRLYDDYNKKLTNYCIFADYERIDKCDSKVALSTMNDEFKKECDRVCPNQAQLCNIILDICYKKSSTRSFAWNMCATQIIHNLLKINNNTICFPVLSTDGDISYCGNKFEIISTQVEGDSYDSIERA